MSGLRLSLALDSGDLHLPEDGRIAVFGPRAGVDDLSALPQGRVQVITVFRPDHDHYSALGYDCALAPEGRYGAALVVLPRAKPLAHARIAQAALVTDGVVIIDGAKGDGVEAILKACRQRTLVSAPVSKAHGKIFWFEANGEFGDWIAGALTRIEDGFVTVPGVFSADGIDPASRLLADTLPRKLGARLADLGGGWGYLSTRALDRDTIQRIDLVEADHSALGCAQINIHDTRLHTHWADATRWRPEALLDTVIMNPPFHAGRSADPALGRGFIAAASAMLKPAGQLWMVANRHLLYEAALAEHFTTSEEVTGDNRFKVLKAARPARKRR